MWFRASRPGIVGTQTLVLFARSHVLRLGSLFVSPLLDWFFYAQPDTPERVINADPDAWYHGSAVSMGADNDAQWRGAVRNPDVVRAMLEDDRAGLTIDREQETADRAAGAEAELPRPRAVVSP